MCVVKHRKFMKKCFIPNHMIKHNSNIFNFMKSSFNLVLCSTNISLTHFMFWHLLPYPLQIQFSNNVHNFKKSHIFIQSRLYLKQKNKIQRNKRRLIPWLVLKLTSSHGCFYMLNVQRTFFPTHILHWYLFLCWNKWKNIFSQNKKKKSSIFFEV